MPQANGIEANLICDGSPLTEYPSGDFAPNTVFCQSTPGQTFEVKVSGPEACSDRTVRLYCDGVFMDGYVFLRGCRVDVTFHGIYLPNDGTRLMPFKFTNIELSEEDDSHSDRIFENLGTVSVELTHCIMGSSEQIPEKTPIPCVASSKKISERNKKASMIPHTISLGASIIAPEPDTTAYSFYLQRDPTPHLRFVWQYRSRDLLIADGHIPRPANPIPDILLLTTPPITRQRDEPRPADGQGLGSSKSREPALPPGRSSNVHLNTLPGIQPNTSGTEPVMIESNSHTENKPDIKPKTSRTVPVMIESNSHTENKPDIKPKTSRTEPVVIDLCDDNPITIFFSSTYDNPILLDDDDDEPTIKSSKRVTQAPISLAQKDDNIPVRIEPETCDNTSPDIQSKQAKRAQLKTLAEDGTQKRMKLDMLSMALHTQPL
ncbi:uncharacterized protein MELLADRAFT_61742 [Melampsora larici-populina 98AG31]|uniref:DUF7918 domain-containing protein n=1 Tax=Melampsora larici-populina (strain 98AG31 / pathotype 3-4-7) TaxID=747676 RepID=F4RFY9_MELLP|nr:uncharacterized protein MELLADRAFT_61742 [Melampsora larici-populina 98AG31]EGG08455.1 hypothetical protein MELLADRAFT_61742 [Melampsora larici-populina 98AG31]